MEFPQTVTRLFEMSNILLNQLSILTVLNYLGNSTFIITLNDTTSAIDVIMLTQMNYWYAEIKDGMKSEQQYKLVQYTLTRFLKKLSSEKPQIGLL